MRTQLAGYCLALALLSMVSSGMNSLLAASNDSRLYELRVYSSAEGKQAEVVKLISSAGVQYMAKHNIRLEAAWVPVDPKDDRVITLVSHQDKATCDASWDAFQKDADWKAALEESSKTGRAVKSFERIFVTTNEYSPLFKASNIGNRVFELRTYGATPGNLVALNNRFKNHTIDLFAKHGMTNIVYWSASKDIPYDASKLLATLAPPSSPAASLDSKATASDVGLIYIIAHASTDAAKASFDSFRQDAAWTKARTESEAAAGGSLTVKDGVKSLFLKPLDFSPLK